jgi:negative regulator of flagellin synthesis FlgM
MKITSANIPAEATVSASAPARTAAPAASAAGSAAAPLQSEVLAPAMQAMQALPDFDHARVAQLRDALAKGELPFDPARLAGLITRFHGSGQ